MVSIQYRGYRPPADTPRIDRPAKHRWRNSGPPSTSPPRPFPTRCSSGSTTTTGCAMPSTSRAGTCVRCWGLRMCGSYTYVCMLNGIGHFGRRLNPNKPNHPSDHPTHSIQYNITHNINNKQARDPGVPVGGGFHPGGLSARARVPVRLVRVFNCLLVCCRACSFFGKWGGMYVFMSRVQ